ncbi:MAG: hypothetical protein C0623_01370 [Desulfuromonas sp.]|nr:MAG: hypothetical protein C0623_01370 [Desulfuromonas sp.]
MKNFSDRTSINADGQSWLLNLSPAVMAIVMSIAIFAAELFVMILIDHMPTFSRYVEAVVDASILIALLVPIYIFFYRPFWRARLQAQEDIEQLNKRLTEAAEDERRRIALDLHEHCDQTLVALQRTIELVQSKVIDSGEEAAALCQEVDELLGRLNKDVRSVSAALHPPQLEGQGLAQVIQQYINQQADQAVGMSIELVEKGHPVNLSQKLGIAIYRIAQEVIRNAIKHSDAQLVRVHLDYTDRNVAISIVDNGKGFDPKKCTTSTCLGLVGVRERVKSLGGSSLIHSEPGKGTSLRASFKL